MVSAEAPSHQRRARLTEARHSWGSDGQRAPLTGDRKPPPPPFPLLTLIHSPSSPILPSPSLPHCFPSSSLPYPFSPLYPLPSSLPHSLPITAFPSPCHLVVCPTSSPPLTLPPLPLVTPYRWSFTVYCPLTSPSHLHYTASRPSPCLQPLAHSQSLILHPVSLCRVSLATQGVRPTHATPTTMNNRVLQEAKWENYAQM